MSVFPITVLNQDLRHSLEFFFFFAFAGMSCTYLLLVGGHYLWCAQLYRPSNQNVSAEHG